MTIATLINDLFLGGTGRNATLTRTLNALNQTDKLTRSDVLSANIDAETPFLITSGYDAIGDGGGGIYIPSVGEPSHPGSVQSLNGLWFELMPEDGGFWFEQFGAKGDGTTDDRQAISDCMDTAMSWANANRHFAAGVGDTGVNVYSVVECRGMPKVYRVSDKITKDDARISLVGQQSIIVPDDFDDFIFELTGQVVRHELKGFQFETTKAGVIKYDTDNSSGSKVTVRDCRFVVDRFDHHADPVNEEIAIWFSGQSSELLIENVFFHGIKHPLHKELCDFATMRNCWSICPSGGRFAAKDAMIRNNTGALLIDDCQFARGPSEETVGGLANGTETAFVNNGYEGQTSADLPNGAAVPYVYIQNKTRMSFEDGAGAAVNHFYEHSGLVDAEQRSGVTIKDFRTSPRDGKRTDILGGSTPFMIRCFDMPHCIIVDGVESAPIRLGVWAPADGVTLSSLLAKVGTVVDYAADPYDEVRPQVFSAYSAKNISAGLPHLVVTTDREDYQRAAQIFNEFDHVFPSDFTTDSAPGNTALATIDTWYTGFDEVRGAHFKVKGGAIIVPSSVITPVEGDLYIQTDGANTEMRYVDRTDYTGLSDSLVFTPEFKTPGGVYSATTTDPANDTVSIKVTRSGGGTIRCRALGVRSAQVPEVHTRFVQAR